MNGATLTTVISVIGLVPSPTTANIPFFFLGLLNNDLLSFIEGRRPLLHPTPSRIILKTQEGKRAALAFIFGALLLGEAAGIKTELADIQYCS